MNEENGRALLSENDFKTHGDEIQKIYTALTELFEPLCERIQELVNGLVVMFEALDKDNEWDRILKMFEKEERYSEMFYLEECRKSDRQDFGNIAYTKGRLFKSQVQLNKPKFIQARSRL